MRVGEELRGNCASFRRASKRSSSGRSSFNAAARNFARRAAYCFARRSRFLLRSIELVFAILSLSPDHVPGWIPLQGSVPEREIEFLQQGLSFFVGARSRADDDVHAPHLFNLVVIDLGEHDVFL